MRSMKRGSVPTHFDRDTTVVKIEGNGAPSQGLWLSTEDRVVITTEAGTVITG
jgi:hypothetical protein